MTPVRDSLGTGSSTELATQVDEKTEPDGGRASRTAIRKDSGPDQRLVKPRIHDQNERPILEAGLADHDLSAARNVDVGVFMSRFMVFP